MIERIMMAATETTTLSRHIHQFPLPRDIVQKLKGLGHTSSMH